VRGTKTLPIEVLQSAGWTVRIENKANVQDQKAAAGLDIDVFPCRSLLGRAANRDSRSLLHRIDADPLYAFLKPSSYSFLAFSCRLDEHK